MNFENFVCKFSKAFFITSVLGMAMCLESSFLQAVKIDIFSRTAFMKPSKQGAAVFLCGYQACDVRSRNKNIINPEDDEDIKQTDGINRTFKDFLTNVGEKVKTKGNVKIIYVIPSSINENLYSGTIGLCNKLEQFSSDVFTNVFMEKIIIKNAFAFFTQLKIEMEAYFRLSDQKKNDFFVSNEKAQKHLVGRMQKKGAIEYNMTIGDLREKLDESINDINKKKEKTNNETLKKYYMNILKIMIDEKNNKILPLFEPFDNKKTCLDFINKPSIGIEGIKKGIELMLTFEYFYKNALLISLLFDALEATDACDCLFFCCQADHIEPADSILKNRSKGTILKGFLSANGYTVASQKSSLEKDSENQKPYFKKLEEQLIKAQPGLAITETIGTMQQKDMCQWCKKEILPQDKVEIVEENKYHQVCYRTYAITESSI